MKRKDFINAVLDIVAFPVEKRGNIFVYSDKLTDGTKVIRIKYTSNITPHNLLECDRLVKEAFSGYSNVKKAEVRGSIPRAWMQFIIQVNYTGELPNLNKKPNQVVKTEEEYTTNPTFKVVELPNKTFKVETPFGVGFATDKEDLDKLLLWLDGVQAGRQMMGNDTENIDPKEEFVQDLKDIEVIEENPAKWWTEAQDIMDRYMTNYGEYFDSYEEMFNMAHDIFREVY